MNIHILRKAQEFFGSIPKEIPSIRVSLGEEFGLPPGTRLFHITY